MILDIKVIDAKGIKKEGNEKSLSAIKWKIYMLFYLDILDHVLSLLKGYAFDLMSFSLLMDCSCYIKEDSNSLFRLVHCLFLSMSVAMRVF